MNLVLIWIDCEASNMFSVGSLLKAKALQLAAETPMLSTVKVVLVYLYAISVAGASVYFFRQQSHIPAVILLIIAIMTLLGASLRRFRDIVDAISVNWAWESKCNGIIEMKIGIEALLQHQTVGELLDRMQAKNLIRDGLNKDERIALLLENYRTRNHNSEGIEKVRYNFKNCILWKNGEVDYGDIIYHEIFIPFDLAADKSESFLFPDITHGLRVRVFVVNGIVKLQIGKYSKELSPDVIGTAIKSYRTYDTVTSFPLLYFGVRHIIPDRYLSLSAYATQSYWDKKKAECSNDKDRDWRSDYKKVLKDLADYKYLCSTTDFYSRRWNQINERFDKIRGDWLKAEKFTNLLKSQEDVEYFDLYDSRIYYSNQYLSIFVANQNKTRKRWEQYLLPDYWEDRP